MQKLKIGIVGYGNVGRGVELAVNESSDMQLAAIFTRRDPSQLASNTPHAKVAHIDDALEYKDDIDALILCGGSATDLPEHGPRFAAHFNTVDSFDTHAKIPEYFDSVNAAAKNTVAIISVGWDPGLFSMQRLLSMAVLPNGSDYTFWGRGVSQGHSDAIRRIDGVRNAIQYTVPIDKAVEAVRNGENPQLSTGEKHYRECYVVAQPGADMADIENKIKTMPNYFAEYETIVNFITEEEFNEQHTSMPHGGFVIRSGVTGQASPDSVALLQSVKQTSLDRAEGSESPEGCRQLIEYSLKLESNPEFTASVLVAYARAAVRMAKEGCTGAKSVFDVPLAYLLDMDAREQLGRLL